MKTSIKLLIALAGTQLALVSCDGSRKPAEAPTAASNPPAPTTTASATEAPVASASAAPVASAPTPDAPRPGVEKTVDMKWELVADTMCQPSEKHVRFRYSAALSRYDDICSARLAEELTKKKPKTVRVTFLVYTDPNSSSLCDVDGIYKGVRLPKGGCRLPDGWDQGAGASGLEGKDVPHPLFTK